MHERASGSSTNTSFTITGDVTFRFYATAAVCFEAEGGIRGLWVAGVQMCALPIYPSDASGALAAGTYGFRAHYNGDSNYDASTSSCENFTRSEERRVGEEGRSRGSPDH